MTKMVRLRIDVPADDALNVIEVRDHLQRALEDRGTEQVTVTRAANGAEGAEGAELGMEMPRAGRVHWPAVTVVLHHEPPPPPPKPAARNRPRNGTPSQD